MLYSYIGKHNCITFVLFCVLGRCSIDNRGRNFVLAFMDSPDDSIELQIYAASQHNRPVNVIVRSLHDDFTSSNLRITEGSYIKYDVPRELLLDGETFIRESAISLSASYDIVVFVVNKDRDSCGGYMAIPTDALGFNYYAITWAPETQNGRRNSQIAVIATEDSTDITVKLPDSLSIRVQVNGVTYRGGDDVELSLDQYEVVQLQDLSYGDLSGTKVEASKKVAVLSGNQYTGVDLMGSDGEDFIVEQMIPFHSYGESYILIPSDGDVLEDRVKILASQDDTDVTVSGQSNLNLRNAGDVETITITEFTTLDSNKPILVVQFIQSARTSRDTSTPASLIVTPVEQYQTGYEFTGTNNDFTSSLVIVVERRYSDNLILDGDGVRTTWQNIAGTDYVTASVQLDDRELHYIYHEDDREFMANVYSLNNDECSVVYPAGMCLEDIRPVSLIY